MERSAYYGLRSIVVLYMIDGFLKMEETDALSVYGWFSISLLASQIVGALIGDLLIGNKSAIIIGAITQAIGSFSLCIPSTMGLYLGLSLIILGGGLYSPNLISNFGKLYLTKTKLLDAGFTFFYFSVNLGVFLGVLIIGYIGEAYGWTLGFSLAGIVMLLSAVPIILSKSKVTEPITENKTIISQRIINISIAIVAAGLFWSVYELGSILIFDVQLMLREFSSFDIPIALWTSIANALFIPISITAIIIWTFFYSSQFVKLTIGLITAAISFSTLFFLPETTSELHLTLYLISLLFLTISEIHIAPILYSVMTQFTNPKYLAILISLVFIPMRVFSIVLGVFNSSDNNTNIGVKVGVIAITITSIGLLFYITWGKKNSLKQSAD